MMLQSNRFYDKSHILFDVNLELEAGHSVCIYPPRADRGAEQREHPQVPGDITKIPGRSTARSSFALAIGLFFGIYAAYQAASLNAIDALRYE